MVERSINPRRNRRPAGTTLAANDSLPMNGNSSLFVVLCCPSQDCKVSASLSCGTVGVKVSEPRNLK